MTGRRGIVLPLLLVFLLAFTAMATIAIHAARHEVVLAGAGIRLLHARLSAEGGVRVASVTVPPERLRLLAAGAPEVVAEGGVGEGGRFRVLAHPLSSGFFLFEGIGRGPGVGGAEFRAARLVWLLDPDAELRTFTAAVGHGASLTLAAGESRVTGEEVLTTPLEWPASLCLPFRPALDSIFPHGWIPASSPLIPPVPPEDVDLPVLGILGLEELLAAADRSGEGLWTPNPTVALGLCSIGHASNWGSPLDPGGPCGRHFPLVVSSGSLVLEGGEAQGILVVAGDLELRGGVHFFGLLLVGGELDLSEGARVDGFARVGGSARVTGGAILSASGCAALRALEAGPLARRLFPPSSGSWLGPL